MQNFDEIHTYYQNALSNAGEQAGIQDLEDSYEQDLFF